MMIKVTLGKLKQYIQESMIGARSSEIPRITKSASTLVRPSQPNHLDDEDELEPFK